MLPALREIMTTLVARGFAMIGPFAVSVITARALGPEDRGQYFLIFSYAQIAAQIANLGLHSSNTYLVANNPERLRALMINSLYVATFLAPLVALVLVTLLDQPQLIGLPAPDGVTGGSMALMAVLLAPLMVGFLYITNMAVAVGRVRFFNLLTIFAGIMVMATAGITALLGGTTAKFLVAAAVALVVSSAVGGRFLLAGQEARLNFDRALFRQGISYAFRAYLATLFGFLMMRVGILALQQQASLEEIGQFSIAMQIADALITIPGIVGLLLFPALVRSAANERWRALWWVFWRLGGAMCLVVAGIALILPWMTIFVFGASYQRAVPLTFALLPMVLTISLISILSQYLAAQGFPRLQVWAWIAGFVMQATLSFLLAGPYGGYGVAIASTASSILVFAILLVEAFAVKGRMVTDHQGHGHPIDSRHEE